MPPSPVIAFASSGRRGSSGGHPCIHPCRPVLTSPLPRLPALLHHMPDHELDQTSLRHCNSESSNPFSPASGPMVSPSSAPSSLGDRCNYLYKKNVPSLPIFPVTVKQKMYTMCSTKCL